MKLKKMLLCILALAVLAGCAPGIEGGDTTQADPAATAAVTPSTEPETTATPEPQDTEEDAKFTFMVEGLESAVSARKHNSLLGYSMVYDHNMLTFEKHDEYDLYAEKEETNLPPVQIKISKENRTVSDLVEALKKNGAEESGYRRLGGCEARVLYYVEGTEYDDVVIAYYVVQAGNSVFLVESSYFFEAVEGSGTRMAQMVDTIEFENVPAAKELRIMFRNKEISDFTSVIGDMTTLRVGTEAGASCEDIQWTTSKESVCTLIPDGGTCEVIITGTGVAEVTVTCGDLSATTVVRGKKSW